MNLRRIRAWLAVWMMVVGGASAQPQSNDRKPPLDREAQAFVQAILGQRPAKELSIGGVLHLRHGDGHRTQVPLTYSVRLADGYWQSVYETERTSFYAPEKLVVTHQATQPNRYDLIQASLDGTRTNASTLTGDEAVVSFASSDFWLSDLGLEFLHWPEQRFVRDAKITMRWGRPLKVVESTNPHPSAKAYARVVSWIDAELGSLVKAEAFDGQGKRIKIFELQSFSKVNGHWEVKNMEIRNEKTDSRTRLEFHFESE